MAKIAAYAVRIDGTNITGAIDDFLISLSVSDKAGTTSDTAEIKLNDKASQIILPKTGNKVEIALGWVNANVSFAAGEAPGLTTIFRGTVDDVKWTLTRGGGQEISVSAKGVDLTEKSKAKEPKQKHFDNKKLSEIMQEAGKDAGIETIKVHPDLASVTIPYEAMIDESFIAFGERIARDVGATFKVSQGTAVLVPRNSGQSASGKPLPTISVTKNVNLHTAEMSPVLGRSRYKKVKARYYDPKEGKYKEVEVETKTEDAAPTFTGRGAEADEDSAKRKAQAGAKDSDRERGGGSVTIEGNVAAQPEAICNLVARDGVDGAYKIDAVEHSYSRGSGFTTKLTLKAADENAGKDTRKAKGSRTSSGG